MLKDYRLLPNQKPKQLAVLLHGVGANGEDLLGLGEVWQTVLPDCAFISPDAQEPYDMAPFGRQWFSLKNWNADAIEKGLKNAQPILDAYLDGLLAEFSLPHHRLALVGFSQGTMLALYAGLRRKAQLAGILAYSGGMFGTENLHAEIITQPPVCLVHGLDDEVVPPAASRAAHQALVKEQVAAALHLCEGVGHSIDNDGLRAGAAFLQRIFA